MSDFSEIYAKWTGEEEKNKIKSSDTYSFADILNKWEKKQSDLKKSKTKKANTTIIKTVKNFGEIYSDWSKKHNEEEEIDKKSSLEVKSE